MRVGGTGDAHGLIHVRAAGQRVADAAADAGRRAAEGLDLGGVIVRLVLEEEQPILVLAVHVDLDLDGTGVDLLALVETREDPLLLEILRTNGAHVHEADGLLVAPELVTHVQVCIEGGLHDLVIDLDVGEFGTEGRVTAMIGPIRIDHLHLGDGRIAMLDVGEVVLEDLDVGKVHRQAALADEDLQDLIVIVDEMLDDLDVIRLGILGLERLDLVERRLARLDGIDDVALDGSDVLIAQIALEQI